MTGPRPPGALGLEDGQVYPGRLLGASLDAVAGDAGRRPGEGEVVFNTCMTGYQEILTDPSYAGQMIVMTYPLIGNYGANPGDPESDRIWARALVVRELAADGSNWRMTGSLDELLVESGVPGLTGVDTRSLTRHLRSAGARPGVIRALTKPHDPPDPKTLSEAHPLLGPPRTLLPTAPPHPP